MSQGEFTAPRNAIEEHLVSVWKTFLEVEKVSVYDDFFELGGHSLLIARIVTAINAHFSLQIPIRAFFQYRSIAALAEYIEVLDSNFSESDQNEYEVLDF